MLEVRRLRVVLGGKVVLRDANHRVPGGAIHAAVGPSGCGKTTLLRAICGLVEIAGEVLVGGVAVHDRATHERGVGLMFQDDQLFPSMNVGRNVGYGLRVTGAGRRETEARVSEVLEMVGLPGLSSRDVGSLSGGERRRVALARSLAPRPKVLLLDEPMTGLHADLRASLMEDVVALLRSTGTTAIIVSHDIAEMRGLVDELVPMHVVDPPPDGDLLPVEDLEGGDEGGVGIRPG